MPTLYVKDVPDGVYEAIQRRAELNKRSLAAEVRQILKEVVLGPVTREQAYAALLDLRQTIEKTAAKWPDVEALVRQDRER